MLNLKTNIVRGFRSAVVALGLAALTAGPAMAAGEKVELKEKDWSWEAFNGTFDRGELQRGFQVYKEVCASCHGLKFVALRTLGDPGGPGFSEAEVKALAAEYTKTIINMDGDEEDVPRIPADTFPYPFENEQIARASNNGAYPPDLSVINKARAGGANYVYSLLTGYEDAPADVEMMEGMSYNKYFSGHQIAMAPPLMDGLVEYADGTAATVEQMSVDVTAFLMWAAEPKLEARKHMGMMVMIFLGIFTVAMFFTYKQIWKDEH